MSVVFFDDCLLKTGVVTSSDLPSIALILEMAEVEVTVEDLKPHVAEMHPDGKCALSAADMEQLFTRLIAGTPQEERESDGTESKAMALDNVAENSSEVNKVCDMTISELADALAENLQHKLQALPKRAQHLVLENFNKLFLDCIGHSVVQLDHEDILKPRNEKIASALPDLIDSAVEHDKGIYFRHRDGGDHVVADLVLLEAPDQEAIRKAWTALSESLQQDVAPEVDKQFQSHLLKIGILVDEDDVSVLKNDWVKGHMLDIIQTSHDLKDTSTREFPFTAKLWPQNIADACRNIWQTLSNAQKDNVVEMMQAGFRQYTAELELTDEKDVEDLSLWESWGTRGFKDAADAVRKNDTMPFTFQPEVAIDTTKDTDKKQKAEAIVQKVQAEHEILIRQEIHRRQVVLRDQIASFDPDTIAKCEIRLLDAEYWNIVMEVMQENLLPPSQIHIGKKKALEDHSAKLAQSASTVGQKSNGSSVVSAQECHVGMNHAAGAVNIGSLVRLNHSPKPASNVSALAFVSAREAFSGDAAGVRWIYDCYMTNADYNIQGGGGKEVATILTCDHTGPLLVSIWSPTLDEFKNIMKQYNPEDGQLMLRFEQLRFAPMLMNEWDGKVVTPMRLAHTLTPEPDSPMKKNKDFKQRLRQCLCATALV